MKVIRNLISNVIFCWWLLFAFAYFDLWIEILFQNMSIAQFQFSSENIGSIVMVFLILGIVFWIINFPIKKILSVLTLPINALTLWIFSLILNIVVFYIFQWIANTYIADITVNLWTIIQTLILSLLMSLGLTILNKLF